MRSDETGNVYLQPKDDLPVSGANLAAIQVTVSGDWSLEVSYTKNNEALPQFRQEFEKRLKSFHAAFSEKFDLSSFSEDKQRIARAAFSNLMSGVGYWHGHSRVKSSTFQAGESKPYGPLTLLSAVPSKPFFPRGFIWDEGFHNLLIHQFDPLLSLDIIASWLDTMNSNGWIPREMILGAEAEAKVPAEFLVQSDDVANPPMFFYLIEKFLDNSNFMVQHAGRVQRLYPRLKQWYIWLRSSQAGPQKGTMQWQGRNTTTPFELNPKTLPSGLDDYPRASHPSNDASEYHLDLRCWMAMASKVLRRLSESVEDMQWIAEVEEDVRLYNDVDLLDKLHWSEKSQSYADFGLHSAKVDLVPVQQAPEAPVTYLRKTLSKPQLRHVDNVFGYVNLFPFLLRILPPNNDKLGILLRRLRNKEELWTPYGLRSLSTKSPYYMRRNTEHDPPYWRGPIWINMNYLALSALWHYAHETGPHQSLAADIYAELKNNVIENVSREYQRTGFFWENYND
ncbi:mannosyl oligosaccharide glucosidase [Aphelenchoides avenae]|nr:mannosyl oligosaccharide glucosidase [Aphelenchus avenae]